MRCENQHPEGKRPEADYVLEDADGKQRAVCGVCASVVVAGRQWVKVIPLDAVGESAMQRKARAQGRRGA